MRRIGAELLLVLVATLAFDGCGSGKFFNPTDRLLVGVQASAGSIDRSQHLSLTATVTEGGAADSSGVTWGTPTCPASSCGTITSTGGNTATYQPPSAVSNLLTVTATATSVKDTTQSGSATFLVAPDPAVSGVASVFPAKIGSAYSIQLISGGTPPYNLQVSAPGSVADGSAAMRLVSYAPSTASTSGCTGLPAWLSFNQNTGILSAANGTIPNTATDFVCTLKVTDALGVSSAGGTVDILVPISITTTALPPTEQTQSSYNATLTAQGGSGVYSWTVLGSLPAGLSLNANTGVISGTVGASATTQQFAIQAAGSASDAVVSESFTIAVSPLLAILQSSASDLTFNISSKHSLTLQTAAGTGAGSLTWTAVSALPSWLSLSSTTGVLSATSVPVTATTSQVTVQVADALGLTATASLNITVPVIITTASLPMAEPTEASYAGPLKAAGGSGTYSWNLIGLLPNGLSLDPVTGLISGAVGANAATQTFSVQVTDTSGAFGSQQYTLTVNPQLAIVAPTSASLIANIGNTYNLTLQNATGTGVGPFTWSVAANSTAPPWLTLSSSGAISASNVPGTAITQPFTVQVKDAANVIATLPVTIVIPIIITPSALPSAEVQTNYSLGLKAEGGSGMYPSWTLVTGSLPAGLSLNPSTGLISGLVAANAAGQTFTVHVTDSNSASGMQQYTLGVNAGVVITTTSLPNWTVNNPYSQNLSAVGGVTPYTWTVVSGSLPAGLTLDSTTGNISSSPGATGCPAGTSNFSVTVQDSLNIASPAQALSITTTTAPVTITTTSIGTYSGGVPYNKPLQARGGVCGATVTWSVASGSSLPGWLNLSPGGVLSGTPGPNDTGNDTFVVQATDGVTTATQSLTLVFSALYNISGQVSLANGGGPLQGVVISLGPNLSATTDSSGNFSIRAGNGTYTITPSFTPSSNPPQSSTFVPASSNITAANGALAITVSGSDLTESNLTALLGYTVSGKVSYVGKLNPLKLNRVFIGLQSTNCNNCSILGTSAPTPVGTPPASSFTVQGVPPGTYMLNAWMDFAGYGIPNAFDPSGTAGPVTVSVANGNITNAAVTVNDATAVGAVSTGPSLKASPIELGAIIQYQPIIQNGVEQATIYNLQWSSTDETSCETAPDGGFIINPVNQPSNPIVAGSGRTVIFDGQNPANAAVLSLPPLQDGPYSICMQAVAVDPVTGVFQPSTWSHVDPPITLGALTGSPGTNTVSGNVTIPDAAPPSGPLYVGCYDVNTGNIYGTSVETGQLSVGQNPYSVSGVPTGASCFIFAMLDQDGDGFITPSNPSQAINNLSSVGDVYNTNAQNPTLVTIVGNTTQDVDLTPFVNNSSSALATQHVRATNLSGSTQQESYNLNFLITPLVSLPTKVTLLSGPNVVAPADFSICTTCGEESEFNIPLSTNGVRPQVGDSYVLQISYSDTTLAPDVVTLTVTGVSDNFATNLSPTGSAPSDTPTFSWVDPANAGSYMYRFLLSDSIGNTVWQIPDQGSFLNFFSSSITSVPWSTTADPTGAKNPPSVASLTSGATYTWSITIRDSNGNSTKTQVNITAP
jgi:hypothetical protein